MPLNRFNLTLVGPSGAGKTSLVRSLMRTPFEKRHLSTELVELSSVHTHDINTRQWVNEDALSEVEMALAGMVESQAHTPASSRSRGDSVVSQDTTPRAASTPDAPHKKNTSHVLQRESAPEAPSSLQQQADCSKSNSELQQKVDYSTVVKYLDDWDHSGCRLRIWDQAGQDVFASTQNFLYASNGAVVHVANLVHFYTHELRALRELDAKLSTTELHSTDCVMLLCLTRLDELELSIPSKERCSEWLDGLSIRLDAHFSVSHPDVHWCRPEGRCFFAIDNTRGDGNYEHQSIQALRDAVEGLIAEDRFGTIKRQIPFRWIRALDAIQDMSNNVLEIAKVTEVAVSFGVKECKVDAMIKTFHEIGGETCIPRADHALLCEGELLYFDTPGLDQWVIAPPQVKSTHLFHFVRV